MKRLKGGCIPAHISSFNVREPYFWDIKILLKSTFYLEIYLFNSTFYLKGRGYEKPISKKHRSVKNDLRPLISFILMKS